MDIFYGAGVHGRACDNVGEAGTRHSGNSVQSDRINFFTQEENIMRAFILVAALGLGGCGYAMGTLDQNSLVQDLAKDPATACVTFTYGPAGAQVVRVMPGAKVSASPGACTVEYSYPPVK